MLEILCFTTMTIFFYLFLFIGFRSLCLKIIFELDKNKDTFIKKKKYFWQRQYQEKTLCKLSDIKTAYRSPTLLFNRLYLKLNPPQKNILLFWCYDIGLSGYFGEMVPLIHPKDQINNFLQDKNSENISVHIPLLYVSVYAFSVSLILAAYIL